MARLKLENVTKVFPGREGHPVRAVERVSLAVESGELLALIGPSGCGKTTTLRLIAGLEEPTHGTISLDDRVLNRIPPRDRDVAMVFQHHALYPHLTAFENMAFGLKLRRVPRDEIERRVRETASLLGLVEGLDRRPRELSGGQRQRAALGRALVRQPRVLLLDEPLSNLDAPLRAQMRSEIARLHRHLKATMIYVTHDQVEALTLGDRVAVMDHGSVQQVDTPLNLHLRPVNVTVAGFIGSPPMNFFHGTVTRQNTALVFGTTAPGFTLPLDDGWAGRMECWCGKPVVLGVRAEDIASATGADASDGVGTLEAVLERVERLGADTHLHATAAGSRFVARVPASDPARPGQMVPFRFRWQRAHFFDTATGRAIPG